MNHSSGVHKFGNELDHLGIVIVIWASIVPTDYFGFYCDTTLRWGYWTLVRWSSFPPFGQN